MYTEPEGKCCGMLSEAKKKSNAKWNAANQVKVGANINRKTAEEFAALCKLNGETMHSVIKRCIDEYIEQNKPM